MDSGAYYNRRSVLAALCVDSDEHHSHFIAVVVLIYFAREAVPPKSSVELEKLWTGLAVFDYQKHYVTERVKRMLLASLPVSPQMAGTSLLYTSLCHLSRLTNPK